MRVPSMGIRGGSRIFQRGCGA